MRAGRRVLLVAGIAVLLLAVGFVVVKSQGAPRAPAATIVMMSDLKNLALRQAYLKDSTGHYTDSLGALDYRLSDGVTTPRLALTPDGYAITLGHERTPRRCAIYAGTTPLAPAAKPEVPACTN